jgi:gamma-glutamylputrescine oxidase
MNLLYSNDTKGAFPRSWYAATAHERTPAPQLRGDAAADICVVGGGFTGLSAALHLAERGYSVALIEAHRVGFGASGRNGGQLGSGQRVEQTDLEKMVGEAEALKLWELAENAKNLVKQLISKHNIDCDLKPGIAHATFSASETAHEHAYVEHLQSRYGYDQITALSEEALSAVCPSPRYKGG